MPFRAPCPTIRGTVTIVLADDHRMVRSAVRLLLDAQVDFEVVAEVGDARAALQSVLDLRPTILVLDLSMPGEPTPLESIPQVIERSPDTAVVVLTMHHDPAFARRALRLGALAFVVKECADEELVDAIRGAAAGETYLAPQLAEPDDPPAPADAAAELTPREIDVLRLIALGHTNPEIADQLVLSVRTVESHRAHLQKKLGRPTRAELVRYALDRHLFAA